MIQDIPDWTTAIETAKKMILGTYEHDNNFEDKTMTCEPKNFQEASQILGKALELLLISKNQKYGKGNILNSTEFGIKPKKGVALRMNDKFERLKNGLQGIDLGKEGFVECFGDMMGYNAIGLMLELNWYKLQIEDVEK